MSRKSKKYAKLKGQELLHLKTSPSQPCDEKKYNNNTHINAHPSKWDKNTVRSWLKKKRLHSLPHINSGQALLQLNPDVFNEYEYPDNEKLFREISKLHILENAWPKPQETQLFQVNEMKRRIKEFQDKWDKIIWIKHYEEINNQTPTSETIALELSLSMPLAQIYLEYYQNMDRYKKKDLYELFCNFDVYNDCLIWWYLIITSLKSYPSKALWLIFARVALITPHKISIRLLQKYQMDLTRFEAKELNKVTEKICIGSKYPIPTALRISKWFKDRAGLDVARANLFLEVQQTYIQAAFNYLSIIESDHLATILLDVKSDINGLSALDMCIQYELTSFVCNDTVERITTSMMNDFEFLTPENKEFSFEINPLSVDLIWSKLWHSYDSFYFTPLGTFITTVFLYILYLCLFTRLSFSEFMVYDPMTPPETLFWVFNMGYVVYEIIQFYAEGVEKYYSKTSNYFDTIISLVFIIGIYVRGHAYVSGPPCETQPDAEQECWVYYFESILFEILWSFVCVLLYVRLLLFCVLSRTLGPMVQIIFNMGDDILTFFIIMMCIFAGFVISLMFLMDGIHEGFDNFPSSFITLFSGLLGDFSFDGFVPVTESNAGVLAAAHIFCIIYLIVAALVLLNILIAMMAKTFDIVHDDTTSTVIFSKFELALNYSTSTATMPPPLNILAMALHVLFKTVELVINWMRLLWHLCRRKRKTEFQIFDLSLRIMPNFLRLRKLGLDDQIVSVGQQDKDEWPWMMKTNEGPTKCRITSYDAQKMKHTVEFPRAVTIEPHVLKQEKWQLDLLDLAVNNDNLIDLGQFAKKVDQIWVNKAHRSMNSRWWRLMTCSFYARNESATSPYWICSFCRSYVKESRVSLMWLGEVLKLNNVELDVVRALNPKICNNCFRVRLEEQRYQLVSEVLSLWIFYVLVGPLLVAIFGLLVVLTSPVVYVKHWKQCIANRLDHGKNGCLHKLFDLNRKDNAYCSYYYDSQLNESLKTQSEEDFLFDEKRAFDVWEFLDEANRAIDIVKLKQDINDHMMTITTDNPLTEYVFLEEYVGIKEVQNIQDVEKLAETIYSHITKTIDNKIPLHLFIKYPFDTGFILNDLQQGWVGYRPKLLKSRNAMEEDEKLEEETKYNMDAYDDEYKQIPVHLMQCDWKQFAGIMDEVKLLNCTNKLEREFILRSIDESDIYRNEKNMYHKLMKYLYDIESLVQEKTIKTLLRDIKTTMDERGIDLLVSAEELQFVCQDLNAMLVIPVFTAFINICNCTKTRKYRDCKKIFLWDIRNILMCIDYLRQTVKHELLHKHCTVRINKQQLIALILRQRANDIVDDDGLIDDNIEEIKHCDPKKEMSKLARAATKHILCDDNELESDDENTSPLLQYGKMKSTVHDLVWTETDFSPNNKKYAESMQFELPSLSQLNMKAFFKSKITKQSLLDIINVIFDITKDKAKISITTINDYYIEHIIRNEETLKFIYQQLKRYTSFHPNKMQNQCIAKELVNMLCEELWFDDTYYIDRECIPHQLNDGGHIDGNCKHNEPYKVIKELYKHYDIIYQESINTKTPRKVKTISNEFEFDDDVSPISLSRFENTRMPTVDEADEVKLQFKLSDNYKSAISISKVFTIAMLYDRIHEKVRNEILDITDLNTVDHVTFIKFVDDMFYCGDCNNPATFRWTVKSRAASDLFHAVLCTQKDVVSLGQVRKTVDSLISDVNNMDCGGIIRVMNHLKTLITRDKKKLQEAMLSNNSTKRPKTKHPRLNLKHYDEAKFGEFIQEIKAPLHECGYLCECRVCCNKTIRRINLDHDEIEKKGSFILEKEAEIVSIINMESCADCNWMFDKVVFDKVLSFSRDSISIQQLYKYSVRFARFLRENVRINEIMNKYHKYMRIKERHNHYRNGDIIQKNGKTDLVAMSHKLRQKELLRKKLENGKAYRWIHERLFGKQTDDKVKPEGVESVGLTEFKKHYFSDKQYRSEGKAKQFKLAINWLYEYSSSNGEMCKNINLFWSFKAKTNESRYSKPHGTMILKIYDFMQNAQHLDGSYCISPQEFALWKRDLETTEESTKRLFYIIRGEMRSLSLKQFYHYFTFLLRMKYHVQDVILRSNQREDTTVSQNGLKIELNIPSDAEAEWLFLAVDQQHEGKLTWKQITQYLEKTLSLRKNMKDFFHEKEKEYKYEMKQAEMITKMTEEQSHILKKLEKIEMDKSNNNASLQKVRDILIGFGRSNNLKYLDFVAAMESVGVKLKNNLGKQIFDDLVSKQEDAQNINNEVLGVDALMRRMEIIVPNHYQLTAKQICQIAMSQLILNEQSRGLVISQYDTTERSLDLSV